MELVLRDGSWFWAAPQVSLAGNDPWHSAGTEKNPQNPSGPKGRAELDGENRQGLEGQDRGGSNG